MSFRYQKTIWNMYIYIYIYILHNCILIKMKYSVLFVLYVLNVLYVLIFCPFCPSDTSLHHRNFSGTGTKRTKRTVSPPPIYIYIVWSMWLIVWSMWLIVWSMWLILGKGSVWGTLQLIRQMFSCGCTPRLPLTFFIFWNISLHLFIKLILYP